MRQLHQVPQSQHGQRAAMALASALVPSPATQPSVQSPSSLSAARLLTPVRPHLSSMHLARPNLHAGGETRAPAPHLQRSRPQLPLSAVQSHINSGQPQLLANKGSLPLSTPQVSPVVPHIYASRAPASGTSQPESRDTNNNDVLPRLSQPPRSEFERWLASNQTLAAGEPQALPSVDAPRTHSTSGVKDVVCISDDEN